MEPISTLILGQLAAAGTGALIDSRKSGKRVELAREQLFSGIHEDLKDSAEICNTLMSQWQEHEKVERATLNRLKRCALTYRHNQELIELLYEHERGDHIFRYFRQINELIGDMEHDQGCLDEIEHAFSEKLYQLRMDNPEISAEQAVEAVVSALEAEHKHYYNGLRDGVECALKRLAELTGHAMELDRELH